MAEGNPASVQAIQQTEPAQAETISAASLTAHRRTFKNLELELTRDELANTGTQKLLLDKLFECEAACAELKSEIKILRPDHSNLRTKVSVLEEKLKAYTSNDLFFTASIGIGCAILGLAPMFFELKENGLLFGFVSIGIFAALVIIAYFSKKALK